jgi:hypothetical protein
MAVTTGFSSNERRAADTARLKCISQNSRWSAALKNNAVRDCHPEGVAIAYPGQSGQAGLVKSWEEYAGCGDFFRSLLEHLCCPSEKLEPGREKSLRRRSLTQQPYPFHRGRFEMTVQD